MSFDRSAIRDLTRREHGLQRIVAGKVDDVFPEIVFLNASVVDELFETPVRSRTLKADRVGDRAGSALAGFLVTGEMREEVDGTRLDDRSNPAP